MVVKHRPLHSVPATAVAGIGADAELVRVVNEKMAIICGMTELLLDSAAGLDQTVARAALESIKRHATGLKELFKHA